MRTRPLAAAVLLLAAACGDDPATGALDAALVDDVAASDATADATPDDEDATPPRPLSWCEDPTRFAYDPVAGTDLTVFPDDLWTREADSLTGLRLDVTAATPWWESQAAFLKPIFLDLASLDGFGTSAGVLLRFSAPLGDVPSGEASLTSDAVILVALDDAGGVERVAFEPQLLDGGATLILWPARPLAPKTRHAAVVTTALRAADGGCVSPSPALRGLLDGGATDPALARLVPRYRDLLARLDLEPDDVSAATVFTTQAIHEASLAAAAEIAERSYGWSGPPTCSSLTPFVRCQGSFRAIDYRNEGYLGDPVPLASYTLPVTVWLPKTGDGPFPFIVFGHGLGGDASQAAPIAQLAAPLGLATVAMPTMRHGDHPTARDDDPNAFFLDLLGIDIGAFTIKGLQFRENLRQASLDKLQLLALLRARPDVDGDGAPDLDPDRVAYFGISLGGIMGADLLALSADVDVAILGLAGGRLMSVVTDGVNFAGFKTILGGIIGDTEAVDRLAPIAQALIDAGDPVNYAPRVLRDRFTGAPPHVLQNLAVDDETVPNVTSHALARALGLEHVPPVVAPIALLPVSGPAPVSGNLDAGAVTAGLFEVDRVSAQVGATPRAATHNNAFGGLEVPYQAFLFLETWLDGGAPIIADPYATFAVPPLR